MSLVKHSPQTEPRPSPSLVDPNTTNTVYVEDPRITSLQKQVDSHTSDIKDLYEQINELKQTKIDISGDKYLVKTSEEKPRPAVNNLAKYVHHECQDVRLPYVINEINNYSTIIQNLRKQISDLDHNKPDPQTVEKLIQESLKWMSRTTAPGVNDNERFDARILNLQAQISSHLELIHGLEKRLEQLQQTKSDQRRIQQLIDESEQRIKTYIDNFSPSVHQKWQDPGLSDILQQIHGHTVSIQDLDNRINQLSNIQPNDQLRKKVDDIEHELKKVHSDLAAILRQLAQQPIPTFQLSLPLPPKNDEDFQAIMPFILLFPNPDFQVPSDYFHTSLLHSMKVH